MYNKNTLIIGIVFLLASCTATKQHVADAEVNYIRANDSYSASENTMESLIAPFRNQMEDDMNTSLGELPETIKKGKPNSNMGNWFCDALLAMSNKYSDKPIDFALQNYGGLRIPSISKGPVTKRHIYELMPFDNKLLILEIDANTVQLIADNLADSNGGPVSKGLTFTIEDEKAVNIEVNGKPLKNDEVYIIGVPDYMANGGGGCGFLKEIPQKDTGIYIRDAIIEHLQDLQKAGQKIEIDNTKRIK